MAPTVIVIQVNGGGDDLPVKTSKTAFLYTTPDSFKSMFLAKTLSFYKRNDIQEEIVKQAKDKEVAFCFGDRFGKRPEILAYPRDVLELAKQKITSFHCSEELWNNPLQLRTNMRKQEQDALRKGWDLVLDIDCKLFPYSKLAAYYAIKALKENKVKSITAKFSGNKGFHIAVPFQSFPEKIAGVPVQDMFPEAPKRIALYITDLIKDKLARAIMKVEKHDFSRIIKRTGLSAQEITRYEKDQYNEKIPKLNIEPFLEIDTLLMSSRHLYRMPYSFHEKSKLVSVPVEINNILKFKKHDAEPENIKVEHPFLERTGNKEDASLLLRNALDYTSGMYLHPEGEEGFKSKQALKSYAQQKNYSLPEKAIGEENFPPCIKRILQGLEDGRKRACFILINFLAGCGWDYDMIEQRIRKWNPQNQEPLREQYFMGQLRYARQNKEVLPPPNCNNPSYYKAFGICTPDNLCAKIKNPLQYAKRKEKKPSGRSKKKKKSKS